MKKHPFDIAMRSILTMSALAILLTGCSKPAPPPPPKDPANPKNETQNPEYLKYLEKTQHRGAPTSGGR